MGAQPNRSTLTIDGTKVNVVSSLVAFETDKDRTGMPQMGSLKTEVRVWIDFHDDQNLPNSSLKKFFDMANVVTRDKIKDVKIEFWKDDSHQDALCSYSFKAWIKGFQTCNPSANGAGDANINHLLVLDLEPALNQANFKEIQMSN
jgi:hypothetical protein